MKVIRKTLDNTTLFAYLNKYGFNFFNKLGEYSTCSFDCEENGLTKTKYAYIEAIGSLGQLYLSCEGKKIELNWYECWDYVL
jgi:hypothetical protein